MNPWNFTAWIDSTALGLSPIRHRLWYHKPTTADKPMISDVLVGNHWSILPKLHVWMVVIRQTGNLIQYSFTTVSPANRSKVTETSYIPYTIVCYSVVSIFPMQILFSKLNFLTYIHHPIPGYFMYLICLPSVSHEFKLVHSVVIFNDHYDTWSLCVNISALIPRIVTSCEVITHVVSTVLSSTPVGIPIVTHENKDATWYQQHRSWLYMYSVIFK